ncbi:MAG TPA: ribonuclease H-like domain-containing protein [Bacillus sp. (in: firmicutes)]|nr:ribonuclease H-like domain-containing protein [Bacillus sp. (in: firmicutes)]
MSMKNKLRRMKQHLNVEKQVSTEDIKEKGEEKKAVGDIPFIEEWKELGAVPYYADDGYCLIREVVYPIGHKHGIHSFRELHHVVEEWNHTSAKHPLSSAGYKSTDLFFFDTETTGLKGGAGTTIFLLGYARVFDDKVVLRQHFLPDPSGEIAFYKSFLECVDYTTLVTYNGKAFDWPQVKTRHTLLREHLPKLPSFGHFDLLHGARRLWKHKLESVKLALVEKEVLQIDRINDVPGFLAPMIYFDYVQSKQPHGIFEVIKHNEHDILSLITLYVHMSKQLLSSLEATAKERFEVARWYETLGDRQTAVKGYESVAGTKDGEHLRAKMALALQCKRECKWEKAMEFWKEVVQQGTGIVKMNAAIELAKVYEHQFKNLDEAIYYAAMAKETNKSLLTRHDVYERELKKRMERLERKRQKQQQK